jgi:hydroxyacyl-ACP dehydratase HTD2-like protein with hotdog domain
MTDRSRIGFTSSPTQHTVDAWRVQLFRQAIGEPASASHVPPTFLKALESEHLSGTALMRLLDVPLRGVLHAEQSFEIDTPVQVDDTVEISRTIADIHDKRGGTMTVIVVDSHFRVGDRPVATTRQTILVRNAPEAAT